MNVRVEEARAERREPEEGDVIPNVGRAKALFLLAAGLSFLLSVSLFFTGNREQGIYVGLWVPSILSAGALLMGGNGHE
jgi:hypothetical protein